MAVKSSLNPEISLLLPLLIRILSILISIGRICKHNFCTLLVTFHRPYVIQGVFEYGSRVIKEVFNL